MSEPDFRTLVISSGSPYSRDTLAPEGESAAPQAVPFGRYRILRLLGEGGMGAVYEAEQDQPRRLVALKLIRVAWAAPDQLRRFGQESEALGRLHHPGIAQIYEAGSVDTGMGAQQPFFAMELIHGKPLVEWADEHKLTTRQRLELVAQVCDAVEHAHQRGIIHRDLKPGNILVDETGQPKILDFGLARATDSDTQASRQTDVGQLLGTLAYMSPEQVLADPLALDTRSDVYALGVILYEMLAGKLPYMLSGMLHEALRTIQQTDPAPLSSINRSYRGDVETIVAKALEKDKTRRYSSASDLAADIRRYLHDEPIVARPASAAYQIGKFARRHKPLVAGVAAVFVVLVAGIVASTREAVLARRAERKAQQQSDIAQAVNDFLQRDLLAQASAYNQSKPDPDLKVRTALERAAQNIGGKFKNQPEIEAAIRTTIGNTYFDLGLYPEARTQLERALDLDRQTLGANDFRTIEMMVDLERVADQQGRLADAEALGEQALEQSRRVLGPDNARTLVAIDTLSDVYDQEGKDAKAEPLAAQGVKIAERTLGKESKQALDLTHHLAIVYFDEGKFTEAENLDKQTLDIRRRVLGPEHPDTLSTMNNLAAVYLREGKTGQAEALDTQMVEIRKHVMGPEHPDTLDSMSNLGHDYRYERKFDKAEALDKQILEIQRRVLGTEHPLTLRSMHNVAADYHMLGENAQAEALDKQTLEIRRRVLGVDAPDTLWSMYNLAGDYRAEGRFQEAAALDKQTLEARRRVLGPAMPDTVRSANALILDSRWLGNLAQAESLYRALLALAPNSAAQLNNLAWFLLSVEDHRMRKPQEALDLARRAVKAEPEQAGYFNTLGLAQMRCGLLDDAIASLQKSSAGDGGDPSDFLFLAMAYKGKGDRPQAERNFAHGVELARKPAETNSELRMFWGEAAEVLGKPGPVPVLPEVKADPDGAMARLKQMAAAGLLKANVLESSADLAPLRGREDFQALARQVRGAAKSGK